MTSLLSGDDEPGSGRHERRARRGLVIAYTGEGKGKTTAALGLALRSVGNGYRVRMIQFIKGTWRYGELEAAKRLAPALEILPRGKGFVGILGDRLPREVHAEAARSALREAQQSMAHRLDMLILDEVSNAIQLGLIQERDVEMLIDMKPPPLHLVFTGRGTSETILARCDLVTEMRLVKHPYDLGEHARRGIEF